MAKMRSLSSMELNDDEKLDTVLPFPMARPDFPCGLRGCLTEAEFEKLGLDPQQAQKGAIFCGDFVARITDVLHRDGSDGKHSRVEFQIENLSIETEDDEEDASDT